MLTFLFSDESEEIYKKCNKVNSSDCSVGKVDVDG